MCHQWKSLSKTVWSRGAFEILCPHKCHSCQECSKHFSRHKDLGRHKKDHAKSSLYCYRNVNWLLKVKIARNQHRAT